MTSDRYYVVRPCRCSFKLGWRLYDDSIEISKVLDGCSVKCCCRVLDWCASRDDVERQQSGIDVDPDISS